MSRTECATSVTPPQSAEIPPEAPALDSHRSPVGLRAFDFAPWTLGVGLPRLPPVGLHHG
jgi:hypothetical protein